MNEETIQAARDAWRRNPEDAAMALLGITPEELFVQAIRGCNQHKHKPGCPDANGGGGGEEKKKKSAPKKAKWKHGVPTSEQLSEHYRDILKRQEPVVEEILDNIRSTFENTNPDNLNEEQRKAYDELSWIEYDYGTMIDRWDRLAKRGTVASARHLEQYVDFDFFKEEEHVRKLLLKMKGFKDED